MAKKKKTKSKKKVNSAPKPKERSMAWAIFGGILLLAIAVFLAMGGLGAGGALPVKLFEGAYSAPPRRKAHTF